MAENQVRSNEGWWRTRALGPALGVLVALAWATLGVTLDDAMNQSNIGGSVVFLLAPVALLCLVALALAARFQPALGRDDGRRELGIVAVDLLIGLAAGEQIRIAILSGVDLAGAAPGLVMTTVVGVPVIAVTFLIVDDLIRSKRELPPPPSTTA